MEVGNGGFSARGRGRNVVSEVAKYCVCLLIGGKKPLFNFRGRFLRFGGKKGTLNFRGGFSRIEGKKKPTGKTPKQPVQKRLYFHISESNQVLILRSTTHNFLRALLKRKYAK